MSADERRPLLVVGAGEGAAKRADALRNRELVLAAARRVVAAEGADGLTMDAVAREAGVGKGTVFRHFGDRAGLIHMLMETGERRFQGRVLSGPTPLGPGAPAADRLRAFGPALMRHKRDHLPLMQQSGSAYGHPTYGAWHLHVQRLLEAAGAPGDAAVGAHLLLSGTDTALLCHLSPEASDETWAEAEAAWVAMANGLLVPR